MDTAVVLGRWHVSAGRLAVLPQLTAQGFWPLSKLEGMAAVPDMLFLGVIHTFYTDIM